MRAYDSFWWTDTVFHHLCAFVSFYFSFSSSQSLPRLFFLCSDPVGLETRANLTFRCRSRFFVRPKFLILFLMKSTRCIHVRDILWDVTKFTMKFRIPAVFTESSIFFVKIKTRSYLCATFFSLSYLSNISRILYLFEAEEKKKKGCRLFLKYQLRI